MSRIDVRCNVVNMKKQLEVTAKGNRDAVVAHEVQRRLVPLLGIPSIICTAEATDETDTAFVVSVKSPNKQTLFSCHAYWLEDAFA